MQVVVFCILSQFFSNTTSALHLNEAEALTDEVADSHAHSRDLDK